jgi:sec-independent protein translocase protein TatA
MPFNLGGPELFIILAIVLIVFGAGRLPSVMRDMGSGVREFRKAQSEAPEAAPPAAPAASPLSLPVEHGVAATPVARASEPAPRA